LLQQLLLLLLLFIGQLLLLLHLVHIFLGVLRCLETLLLVQILVLLPVLL
jgi:hypothetical protein